MTQKSQERLDLATQNTGPAQKSDGASVDRTAGRRLEQASARQGQPGRVSSTEPPSYLPGLSGVPSSDPKGRTPATSGKMRWIYAPTVPLRDKLLFTRQLATMLQSGLSLTQSLRSVAGQLVNPLLSQQLKQVEAQLQNGKTFAGALSQFPQTFDTLFISLIELAELTGTLPETLFRLTIHLESVARLRRQLQAAVLYPMVILVVGFLVSVLMVFRVIPIFEQMFVSSGATLPPPTIAVLAIAQIGRDHLLSLLMLVTLVVAGAGFVRSQPKGRLWVDRQTLKAPFLGELILRIELARYSRTLATLISSGTGLLRALDAASDNFSNQILRDAAAVVRTSITAGRTLNEAMMDTKQFPVILVQMVRVGENTGELERMLIRVADYYDEEVEAGVKALVALLEPALMIFLGVMIGGVLLALYLPIFTLSTVMGQP